MKREIIVVNDFYKDPDAVAAYALTLRYYNPYADNWRGSSSPEAMATTGWHSSFFKKAKDCPFKSSAALIKTLEVMTGEEIDLEHWQRDYPEDPETGAVIDSPEYLIDPAKGMKYGNLIPHSMSCRWNCAFQVKHHQHAALGEGAHDHIEDAWSSVGADGWSGLIYLNKDAPRDSGLKIMKNRYGNDRERFTDPDRWALIDDIGNVYNRLILVRGWMPHVGGDGWGNTLETGRLFQTLFFKTKNPLNIEACEIKL